MFGIRDDRGDPRSKRLERPPCDPLNVWFLLDGQPDFRPAASRRKELKRRPVAGGCLKCTREDEGLGPGHKHMKKSKTKEDTERKCSSQVQTHSWHDWYDYKKIDEKLNLPSLTETSSSEKLKEQKETKHAESTEILNVLVKERSAAQAFEESLSKALE
mmetsp:Transcript_17473/g.28247  ORF Transcript_17473/g.28247 Transcript_17473/m.28247 type:complete len:159 (-) Transcript_17473:1065-1541(-)